MISNMLNDCGHIHFYHQDPDGVVLFVNKVTANFFGMKNESDFIGLSLADLHSQAVHAKQWINNANVIIRDQTPRVFIECATRIDGSVQWFRSYRSPLYGHTGHVLGIHGLSIPINERCLIALTKQQTACLTYLARGYTYKQIGIELGLSQKTVEHYLEAVKLKLNCNSRAELILQAIERGLVGVL